MIVFLLFFVTQTAYPALSSVCKTEFEETICENFTFSPELVLDSSTNKLTIKKSQGSIIHENFSKLQQVTELIIIESSITSVEPGALCSLPNLTSITIGTKFPIITKNVLQGCQRIKRLYLNGPDIQLENNAFIGAPELQTLSLNDTALPQVLEKATFSGLKSLKSLTIQHSKCAHIKEDAFQDLKNIKFIDLQSNKIETIAPKTFRGLTQLKVLNLSDNKLKNLTWDEFEGLKSLRALFLEHNDFNFVNVEKFVTSVPDLERVFFSYDKLSPESRKKIEEVLPKLKITFIYIGKPIN